MRSVAFLRLNRTRDFRSGFESDNSIDKITTTKTKALQINVSL